MTLAATFTLIVFLSCSGTAFAWRGNHMGGGYGAGQNLTAEQYNKLQQLQNEYFNLTYPLEQQFYAKQAELNALYYNNSNIDGDKVQSLTQEIAALKTKLYTANTEFEGKISAQGISVNPGWYNNAGYWGHGGYGGHHGGHGWRHRF